MSNAKNNGLLTELFQAFHLLSKLSNVTQVPNNISLRISDGSWYHHVTTERIVKVIIPVLVPVYAEQLALIVPFVKPKNLPASPAKAPGTGRLRLLLWVLGARFRPLLFDVEG